MEKLQKALQKARDERSRTTRPGTPPRGLETGRAAAPEDPPHPSTDAAWAALKPFEPDAKALEKNRIVTATAGHLGTSFDMLRTKVLLTMRRNGWKRLAVTSPTAGCGKTTTACNLAIGNARNQDIQTILIEFDLRRPSISKSLKMPVTVDLEEMLDRKVDFAEQALRYCSNIAICAAQKPSKDPSTILLSKSTQEVLREIEERYDPDCMIFDLPPLLVNDDTRVVLKDVDCALMVVQAGITTVAQIDACEREIAEHTNMIGVVLNQCRDSDEVYDYYE